ncbi:MAG: hypothetical protein JWM40_2566 [Frankiales bacterium]|nr:hypothetical protein [Frankiales bacterium]
MNRVSCGTCGAPYRPDLTGWTCPVCDALPPEGGPQRLIRGWDDADNRMLAIVLLGTLLNVLLLAALAAVVLSR